MNRPQPSRHAPEEIDRYLASVPADFRVTLRQLRAIIRRCAPLATERVNYQTAIFRLQENYVGFSAAKVHCALHTFSKALVARKLPAIQAAGLRWSGGTIHFKPLSDLPVALVEDVLRARLAELGEG